MLNMLNPKYEKFITEYLKSGCASDAYVKAGFASSCSKQNGYRLLNKPEIQEAIKERIKAKRDKNIAQEDEVLTFLTKVMRGQVKEEQIVVEGTGDGCSEARILKRKVQVNDRIKAAKELHRRYLLGDINEVEEKKEADAQSELNNKLKERANKLSYLDDEEDDT